MTAPTVDFTAIVVTALQAAVDDGGLDALAGDAGRIGSGDLNEPPYPRLLATVTPGGTVDPVSRWRRTAPVQLEAVGDLDGRYESALLADLLEEAVQVLLTLPDLEYPRGVPVVTFVDTSQAAFWSPRPQAQPAWRQIVRITARPARGL